MDQLLQVVVAAVEEVLVVDLVENQAGGERADDRRQLDDVGQIGQQEAEGQRNGEQQALDLQSAGQAEYPR